MREELSIQSIRSNLIRQEETIIFSMIERAQFPLNPIIYQKNAIRLPVSGQSFMGYLLSETEKVHSSVRRYTAPDEHPFTSELSLPIETGIHYEWPVKPIDVNINSQILDLYLQDILPVICMPGDDGNYGSSAVCDVNVLQSLSKRIHYGKFVAESKFIQNREDYSRLILNKDEEGILGLLTDLKVEEQVLNRVEIKSKVYGQDPLSSQPVFKIKPEMIRMIYEKWIIPLTKKVEVDYLLKRLEYAD